MKKCRNCKVDFEPFQTTQVVCSTSCAIDVARKKVKKDYRQQTTKLRKEFQGKDRSYQLKLAQAAFNSYIRERDLYYPCISCGRHHDGQYHAGHYKTIGSHPELRFNERNCYKQCAPCNNHLSGNIIEFRRRLIEIHGVEMVEWLEGPHEPKKYTIDEITHIKDIYKAKLKELTR